MAKREKYLFDNFVVGCKKPSAGSEAEPEPGEMEAEPVFEHPAPPPVEAEIVEAKAERTYTGAELEAKVGAAEEQGYRRGLDEAARKAEGSAALVLGEISGKLSTLVGRADESRRLVEAQFAEMGKKMLVKLVPPLLEQNAAALVAGFVKDNFAALVKEPRLSFYVSPAVAPRIEADIAKLAADGGFVGKINIYKDANLGPADARIEWEAGGVESAPSALVEKVENLLERKEE